MQRYIIFHDLVTALLQNEVAMIYNVGLEEEKWVVYFERNGSEKFRFKIEEPYNMYCTIDTEWFNPRAQMWVYLCANTHVFLIDYLNQGKGTNIFNSVH